jgi:hypothetical protein
MGFNPPASTGVPEMIYPLSKYFSFGKITEFA